MMRTKFNWVVSLVIVATTLGSAEEGAGKRAVTNRPNVLLLLVDDLKPSFNAYGETWVKSPNLDRLAARGLRFDRAYCNQAVCAPSRNNLMLSSRSTSLGIYSLGANFRRAEPEAVTLTQYFMQHGWRAEGIGKIFHVGHGNTNDTASWSVPFQPDKVIPTVMFIPQSFQQKSPWHLFRGEASAHHPEHPLPPVERLLRNVPFSADVQHRLAAIHFPQNPNLVFRRIPFAFHRLVLSSNEIRPHRWPES